MDLHNTANTRLRNAFSLVAAGGGGSPVGAAAYSAEATDLVGAFSATGWHPRIWQHFAGVFVSSSDRRAFLNGWDKGTDTTFQSPQPAGINSFAIGRANGSTPDAYVFGCIAEAALWDVDLEDAEIRKLASGLSPVHIRPNDIVGYWPMVMPRSPERDMRRTNDLAVNGSIESPYHPIITPSYRKTRKEWMFQEQQAGATNLMPQIWM